MNDPFSPAFVPFESSDWSPAYDNGATVACHARAAHAAIDRQITEVRYK